MNLALPHPPDHSRHRPRRRVRAWPRASAVLALVLIALSLTSGPAFAHGLGDEAADRSVLGFVPLGIEHMLLGWDHLLFIGGVVLLARETRRAIKLITVFVLGHSTTLIIATLAGWQVNAGVVDIVIAFSVCAVGAVGVFVPSPNWTLFGAAVLGFGLVHGLGLSTRLQDLGLPEEGTLARVIAFNVGIEIGQIAAIIVMVLVARLVISFLTAERKAPAHRYALTSLFLVGALATTFVALLTFTEEDTPPASAVTVEVETTQGCVVAERTEQFPPMGGHVASNFFEPDQESPLGDFGHSMADGYVVVLYPPSMESGDLDELRTHVLGPQGRGVLAGPHPEEGEDQVKVINAYETMTCEELDLPRLQEFTTAWFESIQ